jgi:hypothetical protein
LKQPRSYTNEREGQNEPSVMMEIDITISGMKNPENHHTNIDSVRLRALALEK